MGLHSMHIWPLTELEEGRCLFANFGYNDDEVYELILWSSYIVCVNTWNLKHIFFIGHNYLCDYTRSGNNGGSKI